MKLFFTHSVFKRLSRNSEAPFSPRDLSSILVIPMSKSRPFQTENMSLDTSVENIKFLPGSISSMTVKLRTLGEFSLIIIVQEDSDTGDLILL